MVIRLAERIVNHKVNDQQHCHQYERTQIETRGEECTDWAGKRPRHGIHGGVHSNDVNEKFTDNGVDHRSH